MGNVVLKVDGRLFEGWKNVNIRRGIEQVTGAFELSVSERWSGQNKPWPINPGDACTVIADDEVVITGHVDDVLVGFDDQSHEIAVVGRDKTGDLVDCSAMNEGGQWFNRSLLQIAKDISKPFGIDVVADEGLDLGDAFESFAINVGESAFEALERAAKMRGVILTSTPTGNLHLTRGAADRALVSLVEGENILSAEKTYSFRDRFSLYLCKGQHPGTNESLAQQHNAGPEGKPARDPEVLRYRPLVILAEEAARPTDLTGRAIWEAAVRAGLSARPVVTVQDWGHEGGLWRPNTLIPVKSPMLSLDEEMLIVSVEYQLGERGTTTRLELSPPEAFTPQPLSQNTTSVNPLTGR